MRRYGILIAVVVCGALALLAIAKWPSITKSFQEGGESRADQLAAQKKAESYLEESMPHEALKIIHRHEEDMQYNTELGKKWLDLFIQASTAAKDYSQLLILYDTYPQAFAGKEQASIDVLYALLEANRMAEFNKLRNEWKGHETFKLEWLILDARRLVAENNRQGAVQLLKSEQFKGAKDVPRLVLLALLNLPDNPKEAWDYLTEADKKDPNNPEIHSYRARLLESVGKKQLALLEYITAAQDAPNNPIFQDQLAEFYLRNNEYPQAMVIWTDILKKWPLDAIWIKALFWNRVITPVKFDWSEAKQPVGKLKPYIDYLLHLKPGEFWNQEHYAEIPHGHSLLTTQQSTFWLRLAQFLKEGKEKDAMALLQANPFSSNSWNPQLGAALEQIIMYRKIGTLNLDAFPNPMQLAPETTKDYENAPATDNAFFHELQALAKGNHEEKSSSKIPADLHNLLVSKEAFAAAFLSTGWYEAALDLHGVDVLPDNFPDWVAIGFTEAILKNRGADEALKFATKQKPSQGLTLVIGELLAAAKETDKAIETLKPLAKEQSKTGERASWLISLIYIEKHQYKEAKEVIEAQPELAKEVLGIETLARIALLEGNTALANKLYSEIEDKSAEAKSYFARKAFLDKNWKKAKTLTEDLIREYPDNETLRENLKKIDEEQKAEENAK